MTTSGSTKAIDLVAVFDAAYEPEWERVAEQDDRTSSSGEADRMATLAGIRAVLACTAPEPAGCVCGEPARMNTVHRTDGPCYQAEPVAQPVCTCKPPEHRGGCPIGRQWVKAWYMRDNHTFALVDLDTDEDAIVGQISEIFHGHNGRYGTLFLRWMPADDRLEDFTLHLNEKFTANAVRSWAGRVMALPRKQPETKGAVRSDKACEWPGCTRHPDKAECGGGGYMTACRCTCHAEKGMASK